jgi:guanylate kinase
LIVVSGPSGVGKSSVVEGLAENVAFDFSVSMTTRGRREGEEEGIDYRFVSRKEFERARESGELVEWAEYGGHLYGTPRAEIDLPRGEGKDVLLDIEMVGARNIKGLYPDAVMIFIAPPSIEELERRLRGRGDTSEEEVSKRLGVAQEQMAEAETLFEHHIVNDDLSAAIERVTDILNRVPDPDSQ